MKKSISFSLKALTFTFIAGILIQASCRQNVSAEKKAEAVITATKADYPASGIAKFEQEKDGKVEMKLELTVPGKANQSVAVHFHEHGMCGNEGNDAHGHWNPTNKQHGKWGSSSFHAGDIGNITLDASGKGQLTLETDLWTIGGDSTTNILNKGIIVHSGVDDYTTQPTGNSGARVACGVIIMK
ncbi:superoxide dismutase family protein [Daejeonella oryzae]|uniref:superoxide dismutase family protein n=1 Tax=Daejeonella oryzae TaxID=1122943 RepID=UPI000415FF75|nr:superoxide dismutase family protein [Daejeonella oryzae]